jgi:Domain of unknown function (DUF4352)
MVNLVKNVEVEMAMTVRPAVSNLNPRQIIGMVLSVLLIVAISLLVYDKEDDSPKVVGVNESVALEGVTYTTKSVEVTSEYNGHKTEGAFVVVTVEARNDGSKPVTVSPSQFLLVDDKGNQYEGDSSRDITLFGDNKYFSITDDINPGLTRTGRMSFEVPSPSGVYFLAIRDNMFDFGGADYVYVKLSK